MLGLQRPEAGQHIHRQPRPHQDRGLRASDHRAAGYRAGSRRYEGGDRSGQGYSVKD